MDGDRTEREQAASELKAERRSPSVEAAFSTGPRIYVASLADYNDGVLHGAWIDAAQEPDELETEVEAMLARSSQAVAEEWAIHDYENFGGVELGEFESFVTVSLIAKGIAEHGEAFGAWATLVDNTEEDLAPFSDYFRGTWESVEAYAECFLDDMGATAALDEIPEWLRPYMTLDVAGYANDLVLGGDITVIKGEAGVHIFGAQE